MSSTTLLTLLAAKGAVVYVTPFAYSETTARPGADEAADCQNPVIRAAVAANPNARLIPLDTYVCTSRSQCKTTVDGVKLRWDGLHYRDHAADVVGRWLTDQIFQPAGAGSGTTLAPGPGAGAGSASTLAPLPTAVPATLVPH